MLVAARRGCDLRFTNPGSPFFADVPYIQRWLYTGDPTSELRPPVRPPEPQGGSTGEYIVPPAEARGNSTRERPHLHGTASKGALQGLARGHRQARLVPLKN
ncbi:hypothetical protein NDU88_000949 [Pleurodeles waltl]|uniref:Uncharacterized protein n=1 Tax=Pleurodeles waltl TaxID=8319 RepID=A0AAV7S909_PLEWA|nr:hypothetical protein NDU88_000949 [Pleurodeles waltl]